MHQGCCATGLQPSNSSPPNISGDFYVSAKPPSLALRWPQTESVLGYRVVLLLSRDLQRVSNTLQGSLTLHRMTSALPDACAKKTDSPKLFWSLTASVWPFSVRDRQSTEQKTIISFFSPPPFTVTLNLTNSQRHAECRWLDLFWCNAKLHVFIWVLIFQPLLLTKAVVLHFCSTDEE